MPKPKYLLIESRDPFESVDVERDYELARGLAAAGHPVTLLLVQNGVLATREGASRNGLAGVVASGAEVLCDEFSLRERGITALLDGVRATPIDVVVDRLADGHKALWL